MATYCAIHANTENVQLIRDEVASFVSGQHGGEAQIIERVRLPKLNGELLQADGSPPTLFALAVAPPGWCTVHFNSFSEMADLAEAISHDGYTRVVVVLAETESQAYTVVVYDRGHCCRQLEFADGAWVRQRGRPFDFESDPLGTNVGRNGEPCYVFKTEDVSAYCRGLGLNIWSPEAETSRWTMVGAAGASDQARRRWWRL